MSFRSWIELESDPGLFTLLVYDFGVKGVEVEEVYDLSTEMEKDVYGFIFLFKWTEERKTRRKAVVIEENFVKDENIENDMFFAQQIIPNSCASHALLSVLLNVPDVSLGCTLKQLRDSCKGFDSESKGLAIGNFWNIAIAHNNHGRPEVRWPSDRSKNVTSGRSMEAFHYVSYIPYNGHLFELDGLKPHPIDHGPWMESECWTDKARRVIQDRILFATGGELSHDIRYNLLAVVPEHREVFKKKMDVLRHNKKVLIELFKKLADKENFIVENPINYVIKQTDPFHPFFKSPKRKSKLRKRGTNSKKSVSFTDELQLSPDNNSSVSTVTGTESVRHPFSDSDGDSDIETYRIKSIVRGKPPIVYVKGEENEIEASKEKSIDDLKLEKSNSVSPETDTKQESSESSDTNKRKSGDDDCSTSKKVKMEDEILERQTVAKDAEIEKNAETNPKVSENINEEFPTSENKETHDKVLSKDDQNLVEGNVAENEQQISEKVSPKGETISEINVVATEENSEKVETDENKESQHTPGIERNEENASEVCLDNIDIGELLNQENAEKLCLENLVKYQHKITLPDLQKCLQDVDKLYKSCYNLYKEELEKIERYKIDDCRRRHNYEPFVATFINMLAEQGHVTSLLEQQNQNATIKRNLSKKDLAGKKKKKFKRK